MAFSNVLLVVLVSCLELVMLYGIGFFDLWFQLLKFVEFTFAGDVLLSFSFRV